MSTRTAPTSTYDSNRGQALDAGEALSLIDRHSAFDGTYRSSRDLRIEGQVKGTLECRGTLHVAQGAQVDAHVEAENVVVAGELSGEIVCRGRLQLMPTGRLRGKVSTQTLVINEGAIYEGQLEMMSPETGTRLASLSAAPRPIASVTGSQPAPAPMPAQEPNPPTSGPTVPEAAPAAPQPMPAPADLRARMESNGGGNPGTSTFIRRFGGPETPFDGRRDDESEEDDEKE
jgi:cytoskeletal protein CcmA (bactofilin family)